MIIELTDIVYFSETINMDETANHFETNFISL